MAGINFKTLLTAFVWTVTAMLLLVLTAGFPPFAVVSIVLLLLPVSLLILRYDRRISIPSLVIILIIAGLAAGPVRALAFTLLPGVPAAVIVVCFMRKKSAYTAVAATALAIFAAYIAMPAVISLAAKTDILKQFSQFMDQVVEISSQYLQMGGFSSEQAQNLLSAYTFNSIKMVLPGSFAIVSLAGAFINYYIVSYILRRSGQQVSEIKPLDEWYVNNSLSLGLFFITIVSWILSTQNVNNADIVLNSILVIFSFVFQINALALLSWFLKKKRVITGVRVFILAIVYLVLSPFLLYFAGLIDFIMDFRKINPSRRRRIPPGE